MSRAVNIIMNASIIVSITVIIELGTNDSIKPFILCLFICVVLNVVDVGMLDSSCDIRKTY